MRKRGTAVFGLLCLLTATVAGEEAFTRWILNERVVYRVYVSSIVPTTLRFPGTIQAIDGAGICTGKENELPGLVLLAFNSGSNYLTLRGLGIEGKAALNITFQNRTYVFDLIVSNRVSPNRCVELALPSSVGMSKKSHSKRKPLSIAGVWSLMNMAKVFDLLATQQPRIVENVERVCPKAVQRFGVYGDVELVLEEIFRFGDEGVLIFRVRLINKGLKEFFYVPHPTKLGVRVGDRVLLSNVCDASGNVLPESESTLFFAVSGDEVRTGLSLTDNNFQVLLSEPQYGVVLKNNG